MKLESQDHKSLRSSLPPCKFPFRHTHSSTSLKAMVYNLYSLIPSNKTNIPIHFSSLNSIFLCKLIEIYSQGKYTITKKNREEIYSLTSIVSPLYFLFLFQNFSLSLSLSLSLILSSIPGFPILKIIFNLTNGLHIVRIVF